VLADIQVEFGGTATMGGSGLGGASSPKMATGDTESFILHGTGPSSSVPYSSDWSP
jgi:hypothetical protein